MCLHGGAGAVVRVSWSAQCMQPACLMILDEPMFCCAVCSVWLCVWGVALQRDAAVGECQRVNAMSKVNVASLQEEVEVRADGSCVSRAVSFALWGHVFREGCHSPYGVMCFREGCHSPYGVMCFREVCHSPYGVMSFERGVSYGPMRT